MSIEPRWNGVDGAPGADGADGQDGADGAPGISKRIEVHTGVTDANGLYTVTYAPAYAATPSVQPEPPLNNNQVWVKVSSTASGFSLRLVQRNSANVLGIDLLLSAVANVAGAAARVLVTEA